MLSVPDHIVKPPYAETGKVTRWQESAVKSPEIIERMRIACSAAAEVLRLAGEFVRPGITTDEIDVYVHNLCIERGAYPSPLNYSGYPKSVCTSVNEVICHGIPDSRVLQEGDIINLDVTCYMNGVHAPGVKNLDHALAAAHHTALAHAEATRAMRAVHSDIESGITLNMTVADPVDPTSAGDVDAARRIDAQHNRLFLDPIFRGAYPADPQPAQAVECAPFPAPDPP